MADFEAKVIGLERLGIKLTMLVEGADKKMGRTVNMIATEIANAARDDVTVDTGDLKESIRAEAGDSETTAYVRAGGPGLGSSEASQRAGGVFYAWHVEMGTQFTPEQPYFRPAIESVTGQSGMIEKIREEWKSLWGIGGASSSSETIGGGDSGGEGGGDEGGGEG